MGGSLLITKFGAEPTQWNLMTYWVPWPKRRGKGQGSGRGAEIPLSFSMTPSFLVTHSLSYPYPRAWGRVTGKEAQQDLPSEPSASCGVGGLGLSSDSVLPYL